MRGVVGSNAEDAEDHGIRREREEAERAKDTKTIESNQSLMWWCYNPRSHAPVEYTVGTCPVAAA